MKTILVVNAVVYFSSLKTATLKKLTAINGHNHEEQPNKNQARDTIFPRTREE